MEMPIAVKTKTKTKLLYPLLHARRHQAQSHACFDGRHPRSDSPAEAAAPAAVKVTVLLVLVLVLVWVPFLVQVGEEGSLPMGEEGRTGDSRAFLLLRPWKRSRAEGHHPYT